MSGTTASFAEFETQLAFVLQHLYDPSLRPQPLLSQILGLAAQDRPDVLQTAVIQAVEDLRPAEYVPKTARSWRMYAILYYHFVCNFAQEKVAEQIAITPRHLRREQASAIHLLALKFWEAAHLPMPEGGESIHEGEDSPVELTAPEPKIGSDSSEQQLKNDLLALQESAPGVISDVHQVVKSVLALAERVPSARSLRIKVISRPGALRVAMHPSALRQVLWMILRESIQACTACSVEITWGAKDNLAFIELIFDEAFQFDPHREQVINEILSVQSGHFSVLSVQAGVTFRLELVNVDRKVLVVDDNQDIIHLYERYLVRTPYFLLHLAAGQDIFQCARETHPDVIVLDIMLPDLDGWDLLTRLAEHPDTRTIPIIVCSVVSDPDLALALGAVQCLSKPVQRHEFIRALSEATSRV